MNIPQNTVNNSNNLDYKGYLENINDQMEIIKEKYADPLDGVLIYNQNGVCTTFFGNKEGNISKDEIEKIEQEISDTMDKIDGIKSEIISKEFIPQSLKSVYINSLDATKNKFLMFKNAIWIEGAKSGYNLSDTDKNKYFKNIIDLQKKIYGERVSDTPNEVDVILKKFHTIFENKKDKLSEGERYIFNKFLDESDEKYSFSYTKPNITDKGKGEKKKKSEEEKNIDKTKLHKIAKDMVNFYKNYFGEKSNLKNWDVVMQDGISSLNILGIQEKFRIPAEYDNVDDEKINKTVIGHEIEQHLLGWDNTNRILGKGFSCGKYDFISEGVAKLNEDIAMGKVNSLEDLKGLKEGISMGIIGVFVCENYDYDDAVKILTIYKKLSSNKDGEQCKNEAETMVKRRKRFVPYDLPGSSIKDTLYQRGKSRVIDYLTEDNNLQEAIKKYKDLNTFKFGPEELKYIDDIKNELNIKDENLIYTLFIGRILHDKLNKGKGSAKDYLKEMNLNREKLDLKTKKALINILKLLKGEEY